MDLGNISEIIDETLNEDGIFTNGKLNLKSFDVQEGLCDTFWNEDLTLKEDIRSHLLKIAKDFSSKMDFTEIFPKGEVPEKSNIFKDVLFVGSLASYNYSEYSDVDLHILANLDSIPDSERNLLKKYFWFVKDNWNKKHSDLTIKGYDVELYVQDETEKNAANGVYSLLKDKWLKVPKTMDGKFDKGYVTYVSKDFIEKIDKMEKILNGNPSDETLQKIADCSEKFKEKIIQNRRNSLGSDGNEFSNDNIVFKVLRRTGYIEKLNDLITKAYDMKNSLAEKQRIMEGSNLPESIVLNLYSELNKMKNGKCMFLLNSLSSTRKLGIDSLMKKLKRMKSIKALDENAEGLVVNAKLSPEAKKEKIDLESLNLEGPTRKVLEKILPGKYSKFESFFVNINGNKYFTLVCI